MNTSTRFQDNTTATDVDRRRILGYSPGHLIMEMSPLGSNLSQKHIPQGELIVFKPKIEGFLRDAMKTVEGTGRGGAVEMKLAYDGKMEISSRQFADAVLARFTGIRDFGFRILDCLTPLEYDKRTGEDDADTYFALMHPSLTCEMGLETSRDRPCPTCRLEWLESTVCQEAIFNSRLDHNVLETLRKTLIASNKAGLDFARDSFERVKGEIESDMPHRRRSFNDIDRHNMKMLHEKAPHIQQAELVNTQARIQGEAIGQSVANAFQQQDEIRQLREENARLIQSLNQEENNVRKEELSTREEGGTDTEAGTGDDVQKRRPGRPFGRKN